MVITSIENSLKKKDESDKVNYQERQNWESLKDRDQGHLKFMKKDMFRLVQQYNLITLTRCWFSWIF